MNRTLLGCAIVAMLITYASAATAPQTPEKGDFLTLPADQWKLLWNDEFDAETLDEKKWSIGLPWRGTDGEGRHHNDQYASYIMDHNVLVEGGKLKLLTQREEVNDRRGRTFHFTQGLITTAKSFRHRYGYFEARVKLPIEAGPGLWPAFWTLAEGWPPEMDICEIWTSSNRSHQGLCYRPAEGGSHADSSARPRERWDDTETRTPLPTDWTTYGMEWGPGYQAYNINGVVTKRVFGDHVTDDPHYILLNSGVESANKPTAATIFPNAFEVDYVRVYQRPDVAVVHNGDFEQESQRPWGRSGQVVVVAYGAHGGKNALRVDAREEGTASTSEQKIYALNPRTTYTLSGWAKMLSASGEARLGVKNHGGDEVFSSATTPDYQKLEVEFTTGPETTTAIIYCYVPNNIGAALFDDIAVQRK